MLKSRTSILASQATFYSRTQRQESESERDKDIAEYVEKLGVAGHAAKPIHMTSNKPDTSAGFSTTIRSFHYDTSATELKQGDISSDHKPKATSKRSQEERKSERPTSRIENKTDPGMSQKVQEKPRVINLQQKV